MPRQRYYQVHALCKLRGNPKQNAAGSFLQLFRRVRIAIGVLARHYERHGLLALSPCRRKTRIFTLLPTLGAKCTGRHVQYPNGLIRSV